METIKEKEKPSVLAALSSHRVAWATHAELGVCPGGDRVTTWQRPGEPRGTLAPGLTREEPREGQQFARVTKQDHSN